MDNLSTSNNSLVSRFSIINLDGTLCKYKIFYTVKCKEDKENRKINVDICKLVYYAFEIPNTNKYRLTVEIHGGTYTIYTDEVNNKYIENNTDYTAMLIKSFELLNNLTLNNSDDNSKYVYINLIWKLLLLSHAYKNNEVLKENMIFEEKNTNIIFNIVHNELDTAFDINNKYETDTNSTTEEIEYFLLNV